MEYGIFCDEVLKFPEWNYFCIQLFYKGFREQGVF